MKTDNLKQLEIQLKVFASQFGLYILETGFKLDKEIMYAYYALNELGNKPFLDS